ncbi:MAG: VCBS repeat-containing protein [Verrucomicrobiales bacterium]|nr:VCBS repeat-containing protein [Verrucomicrobiales bacterium]
MKMVQLVPKTVTMVVPGTGRWGRRLRWLELVSLLALAHHGIGVAETPIRSVPLPTRIPVPGTLFAPVPSQVSGVDLVHEFPAAGTLAHLQEQGSGAGVAIGDYDGDGLPDLFFANYDRGCRLYRNLGRWRFEEVSDTAGVRAPGRWAAGVTFLDVDNDGDLDLFIACYGSPNVLFTNQGDGTFVDRAESLGLAWTGSSVMGVFGDYDRDGRLDCYLLTHRNSSSPNQRVPANTAEAARRGTIVRNATGKWEVSARDRGLFDLIPKTEGSAELILAGEADRLFRQMADGTFEEVTEKSGIRGYDVGLSACWWDYDADGWPDLYVANDHKSPDHLWHNQRDGTFREVSQVALPHVPFASMGTDLADVDNDGLIDLLATEMAGSTRARRMTIQNGFDENRWFFEGAVPRQYPRNALFLATGTPRTFEVAFLAGLAETDWTWSPKWGDFDNDGWVDLFVANGMSRDYLNGDLLAQPGVGGSRSWRHRPLLREVNLAFRNQGQLSFVPRETEWGLNRSSASFGASLGDLDSDGDLDLVVMNLGETPTLYENREANHRRLQVRLVGRHANRFGVGAVVTAQIGRDRQTRMITLSSGFMSSNEPLIHFGLADQDQVPILSVQWPGGGRQNFQNVAADRLYTIEEPDAFPTSVPPPAPPPPRWFESRTHPGFVHQRVPSDEFARETSLPWQLSRMGPCLALGDIDGDGDVDFFLGGTPRRSGAIGIRQADGSLQPVPLALPDAARPPAVEDAGAAFFDSNGDGALDLYVASGGASSEPGSHPLRDRLYLGNGRGTFRQAPPGTVPDACEPAGPVVAADVDRDGDLDLFIGGRSVPGAYPRAARSRLLLNDSGRLVEVTDALAPGLATAGIVTGAIWSDANQDGWIDLLLAREWGAPGLFRNDRGRLIDATSASGFASRPGLWQGIAPGDFDGDGDLDYATVNFGSNSRYAVATKGAVALARGDFWKTGRIHLLETFLENGRRYPLRHRSTLLMEAPFLLARFPTYHSMAQADLATLLGRDDDLRAESVEINTVDSGVWINNGVGIFRFEPLPALAQAAPTLGVGVADFDGDLKDDIVLAQNFRGANLEIGPLDGTMGLVLRGTGEGHFEPLAPASSGMAIPDEGRAVVVTDGNGDGAPDLLVSVHDGPLVELRNTGWPRDAGILPFTVQVRGRAGNPTAIGSRIEVHFRDRRRRVVEVNSGQGGGGADGMSFFFPHPATNPPVSVTIRWPSGALTTNPVNPGARSARCIETPAPPVTPE